MWVIVGEEEDAGVGEGAEEDVVGAGDGGGGEVAGEGGEVELGLEGVVVVLHG